MEIKASVPGPHDRQDLRSLGPHGLTSTCIHFLPLHSSFWTKVFSASPCMWLK